METLAVASIQPLALALKVVVTIHAHDATRHKNTLKLDSDGTLQRLKPFRGLTQAASRIACVLAIAIGSLLSSAAYAYAPKQGFEKIDALKAYASMQMNQMQYACVEKLYTYESHWNPLATNGTHWGIPQGESSWLRNKSGYIQIDWGLRYIKHRYKTPCNALHHFNRYGWH